MSQLIELLGREKQYKLTYSPATSLSVEVVIALEAAKRISFTRKVKATCTAKKVQSCLQYVKQSFVWLSILADFVVDVDHFYVLSAVSEVESCMVVVFSRFCGGWGSLLYFVCCCLLLLYYV